MQTIDNLGKRVWKAAQKEMKRTANAEKNLQKSRNTVLQARFLFCRQDFSAKKVEPQCFKQDFSIYFNGQNLNFISVGECSSKVVQWQ